MEMHQVRYFLGVARTLNFTRAAEECNVAQPSLTRAIRQLEDELGGDLFRRERPHAQLTELGQRMQPLLQQCYDSAVGAMYLSESIDVDPASNNASVGSVPDLQSWCHRIRDHCAAFSASSSSSTVIRRRKSGSMNRARIMPTRPTINVAGIGNIHEPSP